MQVQWNILKELALSKKVGFDHIEEDTRHKVSICDNNLNAFFCFINKSDPRNADQVDFEDNYLSTVNQPCITKSELLPFSNANGFRFRGASFKGTCSTGVITDIDFKLTEERWINGGQAIIDNIGNDDTITFQVIDKDNIFGLGANTVLDEFITDFYMPTKGDLDISLDYPAKIIAGLYLRLKYTSTHPDGCTLKCNLYLHWKSN